MESTRVVLAAALVVAALAVLLLAVSRRWFARHPRGFLLSVMVALVGTGLGIAGVIGVWAYAEVRATLVRQIVTELTHIADIQQNEIREDLAVAEEQLQFFATHLTDSARKNPAAVRERLRDLQLFDPRYLQVSLMDAEGRPLVASSVGADTEPYNRVGTAHSLEGKPFASDVYVSPVFNRWVIYIATPVKDDRGTIIGVVSARYDMQDDLKAFVNVARFGATGYTVVTNGEGRVMAHPDDRRLNEDITRYPVVKAALEGRTTDAITVNAQGTEMLMVGRPFKSPASQQAKPWVLISETTTAEAFAPIHPLRIKFAVAALAAAIACVVVAVLVSRSITRPLHDVVDVVHKIRGGDLLAHTAVTGHDEIGSLGVALNEMTQGLRDRDRVKEIFGRYVTTQVSQELLSKEITLGGERRRVTLLFSDIRNFTSMSEAMTPESIIAFLNEYFSEMVDAVFEQHGVLDKFIGDGMLAVFGTLDERTDHERRAVRAALRMKARLAKLNGDRSIVGQAPIAIGIGIHTDDVVVGNIGSRRRLEYTVIGDGVNTCSRVEGLNKEFGTTILITETTFATVRDDFECRAMPEAPLKGKTKVPRIYEVLSHKQPTVG
ncbi:MAG TPA: adenylate/guanylate cyclase domain-containing protein [Methylomirabilota bacterium]|nr:adenylate/guanylate cyclase domain-containing protein [Methylomirabilota bacterium]